MQKETMPKLQLQESMRDPGKCYMCGKPGHITRHCCNQEGSKSSGQKASKLGYSNQTHTHQVQGKEKDRTRCRIRDDPSGHLYSLEDSAEKIQVKNIVMRDGGQPHCAHIRIQGVPAVEMVDNRAYITLLELSSQSVTH